MRTVNKNSPVSCFIIIFSSTEFVFLRLMSIILHIETSTDVCSVCLASDGNIISKKETGIERSHASILTVFIDEIFDKLREINKKLDAVAVSMGPGSYTGLRIGVSAAKGICYGAEIPLIAIPTLEAMCIGVQKKIDIIEKDALLIPMIDARRMEVYMAVYDTQLHKIKNTSAQIINVESFHELSATNTLFLFGSGSEKLKDTIRHKNIRFLDNITMSSEYMVDMALKRYKEKQFEDVAYFEPYYLKDFIATTPKKNQLRS
jgi:tRNA threonylcarbamoyladenosine biosynthesis protein TsaB